MSAESDCHKLIQQIVSTRDVCCRRPGCSGRPVAGHHSFGRSNPTTAFNPRYAVGLCVRCHIPWGHGKPVEFREWLMSWMGEEEYYEALRLSNQPLKNIDYDQIKEDLKSILNALKY